jgi:hypothetical protein
LPHQLIVENFAHEFFEAKTFFEQESELNGKIILDKTFLSFSGESLYLLAMYFVTIQKDKLYEVCIKKAMEKGCREAINLRAHRIQLNKDISVESARELFEKSWNMYYEFDDSKRSK